jgi:hypothetical protein
LGTERSAHHIWRLRSARDSWGLQREASVRQILSHIRGQVVGVLGSMKIGRFRYWNRDKVSEGGHQGEWRILCPECAFHVRWPTAVYSHSHRGPKRAQGARKENRTLKTSSTLRSTQNLSRECSMQLRSQLTLLSFQSITCLRRSEKCFATILKRASGKESFGKRRVLWEHQSYSC